MPQVVVSHAGCSLELLAVAPSGAAASISVQPIPAGEVVADMRALRDSGGNTDASSARVGSPNRQLEPGAA